MYYPLPPDNKYSHRKVSGLSLWVVCLTVSSVLKLHDRSIASSLNEREWRELGRGERGGTEGDMEGTWSER